MSVSPLHLTSNFNSYMSGEVTIDPSAAIAAGVVLQADSNSRIIIAAGVCIGMGAILHARDGTLEIEVGANLGAGVLVVGKGKIGTNACIGSVTTIVNCSIEPGRVVPPGSLIGDTSRQVPLPSADRTPPAEAAVTDAAQNKEPEAEKKQLPSESIQPTGTQVIYGKASVTRLIATLLPHSQSLSQPFQDGSAPSERT